MTKQDLEQRNFYYVPVSTKERLPELMKFVPVIDTDGEIAIYRLTEHGWNMRDGMADNSPNNNKEIVCWLEKINLVESEQKETFLKMLDVDKINYLIQNGTVQEPIDYVNNRLTN